MSTRSNIKLIDSNGETLLYKHQDGYPESEHGMIALLAKYLRGSGITAQTMADNLVEFEYCEISDTMHDDMAYYYEVEITTGKIQVFEHSMRKDTNKLIKTVNMLEVAN